MKKRYFAIIFAVFLLLQAGIGKASAMPFYGLEPKPLELRAEFSTGYSTSGEERKHNIALAAKALDHALIAPGEEFSFNARVGERSAARGYKEAKIIVNGKFTEGIGGGVCQVSTTLYNAALCAGMRITEYHPHSLQVGYVKPGADAMVNYYFADLRFVNVTKNPVYLKTKADGKTLTVQVYGEKMEGRIELMSKIVGETAPGETILIDTEGKYPELPKGERMILRYGKAGVRSESYVLRYSESGKLIEKKRVRKDSYLPVDSVVVEGTAEPVGCEREPIGAEETPQEEKTA